MPTWRLPPTSLQPDLDAVGTLSPPQPTLRTARQVAKCSLCGAEVDGSACHSASVLLSLLQTRSTEVRGFLRALVRRRGLRTSFAGGCSVLHRFDFASLLCGKRLELPSQFGEFTVLGFRRPGCRLRRGAGAVGVPLSFVNLSAELEGHVFLVRESE